MCSGQAISMILQGVGQGAQAQAQLWSAESSAKQLEYQANMNELNAELAQQDQALVQDQDGIAQSEVAIYSAQLRGEQAAQYAGNNVLLNSGSAQRFDEQAIQKQMIEQSRIQSKADLEKRELEIERRSLLSEAQLLRQGAKQTRKSGRLSAIGSFLGAAGSIGGQGYSSYQSRRGRVSTSSELGS